MDLVTVALLAAASAGAAALLLTRTIGWKRMIRHNALIDIAFTALMFGVFSGTLGGALVATIGGLFLSLGLTVGQHVTALVAPTK